MKWNKEASKQVTFYTGEADTGSRIEAMKELWDLVDTELIPQNEGIQWDYIRIEFWPDSGRVIVFPGIKGSDKRIEKAGCQIVFEELLSTYEVLADSGIDDDQFTERLASIQGDWASELLQSAKDANLTNLCLSFWGAEADHAFLEVELT